MNGLSHSSLDYNLDGILVSVSLTEGVITEVLGPGKHTR